MKEISEGSGLTRRTLRTIETPEDFFQIFGRTGERFFDFHSDVEGVYQWALRTLLAEGGFTVEGPASVFWRGSWIEMDVGAVCWFEQVPAHDTRGGYAAQIVRGVAYARGMLGAGNADAAAREALQLGRIIEEAKWKLGVERHAIRSLNATAAKRKQWEDDKALARELFAKCLELPGNDNLIDLFALKWKFAKELKHTPSHDAAEKRLSKAFPDGIPSRNRQV